MFALVATLRVATHAGTNHVLASAGIDATPLRTSLRRSGSQRTVGRFVSWHLLATSLGVNFSYVAYRDAIGRPFKAREQVDGPRWIWTARDVPDSVGEIFRGEMSAVEWVSSLRGTRVDGVLSLKDPAPGLLEIARLGGRGVRRCLPFVPSDGHLVHEEETPSCPA